MDIKIKGALSLEMLEDERKTNICSPYVFQSVIQGLCSRQACTASMLKEYIKGMIKENRLPSYVNMYLKCISLKKVIKNCVWDTNGIRRYWRKFDISFSTYYLYEDKNYISPYLLDTEELPLYINRQWAIDLEEEWFKERLKNNK